MALPKYKTSRANTHSRRANWKAKAAQTVTCPNCGAPTLPHMARRQLIWRFCYASNVCRTPIARGNKSQCNRRIT